MNSITGTLAAPASNAWVAGKDSAFADVVGAVKVGADATEVEIASTFTVAV